MSVTSPPLSVWFLTLAILAVLGAVVMIAFLVLEDPLAYLAGRIEPLMSWPAAASA